MLLERNKIIELVATLMGLAINSITMITLCSWGKRKLTSRARLLVSITAANLVAAIGVVITLLVTIYRPAMNMFCSNWTEMLIEDVRISGTILIMLGLCSLSLDLYLTVNHSMHYQIYSRRVTTVVIAGTWILGICLGFLSVFVNLITSDISNKSDAARCHITEHDYQRNMDVRTKSKSPGDLQKQQRTHKFLAMFTIPPLPPVPLQYNEIQQPLLRPPTRELSKRKYLAMLTIPPLPPVPWHNTETPPILLPRLPQIPEQQGLLEQAPRNVTILMHQSRYLGYATQTVVTAVGLIVISTLLTLIFRRILRPTCGQGSVTANRRRGACTIFLLLLAFVITMLPCLLSELYMFVQVALHTNTEIIHDEVAYFLRVQPYLHALTICYTVASPIILYTRMREVRNSYRHVLFRLKRKFNRSSGAEAVVTAAATTGAGEAAPLCNTTVAAQLLASSHTASWRQRQLRQEEMVGDSEESNNDDGNCLNLDRMVASPDDNWIENEEDIRHLITHSTPL